MSKKIYRVLLAIGMAGLFVCLVGCSSQSPAPVERQIVYVTLEPTPEPETYTSAPKTYKSSVSEFPAQAAMDEYNANSVRAEENYVDGTYWCELKISDVAEAFGKNRIRGTISGTSLTAEFQMSSSADVTSVSKGDLVQLKGTLNRYGFLYDFIFENGSFYS